MSQTWLDRVHFAVNTRQEARRLGLQGSFQVLQVAVIETRKNELITLNSWLLPLINFYQLKNIKYFT